MSISKDLIDLEHEIQAVHWQLEEMQQGKGLSFWPKPILHPIPPIDGDSSLVYILLKPRGYYKRWFTSYDVAITSCKHTYHPFCLTHLCKEDDKCLVCK